MSGDNEYITPRRSMHNFQSFAATAGDGLETIGFIRLCPHPVRGVDRGHHPIGFDSAFLQHVQSVRRKEDHKSSAAAAAAYCGA